MLRQRSRLTWRAIVIAFLSGALGGVWTLSYLRKPLVSQSAIEQSLERRISLPLETGSLQLAVQRVAKAANLTIHVDYAALEARGIDRNTPITFGGTNVPVSDMLQSFVESIATPTATIVWRLDGNQIVICKGESDKGVVYATTVRVYDVHDLIAGAAAQPAAARYRYNGQNVAPGLIATSSTASIRDQLANLIVQNVSPHSWNQVGPRIDGEPDDYPPQITALGDRLIIRQTPIVHAQIRALLEDLRWPRTPAPLPPVGPTPEVLRYNAQSNVWFSTAPPVSANPALDEKLDTTIKRIDLKNATLVEALAKVGEAAGVKTRFIPPGRLDVPNLGGRRIDIDLQGVTLADALTIITHLASAGEVRVDWWVSGQVICVGAEMDYELLKVTRLYDLRDWIATTSGIRPVAVNDPEFPRLADQYKHQTEQLIDALLDQVDMTSWSSHGGLRGDFKEMGGFLAVTQTWENQAKVRRFLNALRSTTPTSPATQPAGRSAKTP